MGVCGLLQYILSNPSTREKVQLRQFAEAHRQKTGKQPEILCDLVCVVEWLLSRLDYALMERGVDSLYGLIHCGVLGDYSERVLSFVRILQGLGLKVVFCVDGCPDTKEEFDILYAAYYAECQKKQKEAATMLQICSSNQDMTQVHWTLKDGVLNHVIFTLEAIEDVRIMYCNGQVLARAISYMQSHRHVCGILSSNTSYAVAPACGLFLLDLLRLDVDQFAPSLPALSTNQDLSCEVVWSTWLASSLDLSEHQLANMAAVCGNEYTQHLNADLEVVHALGIAGSGTVVEVAEWLRNQKVHLSAVPEMVRVIKSNPSYQKAIDMSYQTYRKGKELLLPDVLDMYPVLQAVVYAGGLLSPQMVSVVAGEVYWRPALIEPDTLNCPRFCDITILIRKFIYALVGVSKVTEFGYITSSSSLTQIPIEVVHSPAVDLPMLFSLSKCKRLSILYRFVTSPRNLEGPGDIEELVSVAKTDGEGIKGDFPNSGGVLLFCVLVFMRTANQRLSPSPNIFVSDLEAILASILCSIADLPLLSLKHVPPAKGVTLASWLSHLLNQTYWLASCLGLSRDLPAPGSVFSAHQYIPFHLASSLSENLAESSLLDTDPSLHCMCSLYQRIWELAPVLALRARLLEERVPSLSVVLQVVGSAVAAVAADQTLHELAKKLERHIPQSPSRHPSSVTTTASEVSGFQLDLDDSALSGVDSPHSLGREELSSTQECNATEEDHFFSSQSLGASCDMESCNNEECNAAYDSDQEDVGPLGCDLMDDRYLMTGLDISRQLSESSVESIVMSEESHLVTTEEGAGFVSADLSVSGETVALKGAVPTDETNVIPDKVKVEVGTHNPELFKPRKHFKKPSAKAAKPDLPIMKHRSRILELIRDHKVVCIEGETGCGKSTMVPQFILDESLDQEKEPLCRILVTQPRRVAAIKLAERVSAERGERLGGTVGYCVGGDHHRAARTRLTYCTVGYLLQVMKGEGGAGGGRRGRGGREGGRRGEGGGGGGREGGGGGRGEGGLGSGEGARVNACCDK
jgi:hypothetical protein